MEIDGLGTIRLAMERGNVESAKKMAVVSGNFLTIMQISKDCWPL